jgi:hyperosmotically inducible protein
MRLRCCPAYRPYVLIDSLTVDAASQRFTSGSRALPSTASITIPKEHTMFTRLTIAAMIAATTLVTATGCAVERHQETVGSYVDDSAVTTKVKAKFAEDPTVSAMAIKVDTMKGVVQLSGFAKSNDERMMADRLARNTNGVVDVRNDIIVK